MKIIFFSITKLEVVITCFFMYLFTLGINAQDYKHFLNKKARWIVYEDDQRFPDRFPVDYMYEYYFTGDTVFNGVEYTTMVRRELNSVNNDYYKPYKYIGSEELQAFIREDTLNKKVYAVHVNFPANCQRFNEELLYDFSLEIGDTVDLCNIEYTMFEVDAIQESAKYPGHDIYYFVDEVQRPFVLFYEGIGVEQGPLGYNGWAEDYIFELKSYCLGNAELCDIITSIENENAILGDFKMLYSGDGRYSVSISNNTIESIIVTSSVGKKVLIESSLNNNEFTLINAVSGIYFVSVKLQSGLVINRKIYLP